MSIFTAAIDLLVQPPGDLVYFLVTLFALQQALLPASLMRRAAPEAPAPRRWLWALGGMLAGRVVLILFGLLGLAEVLSPATWLPPLERLIEVAGTLLVLWALWSDRAARWQSWVLIILLLATVGFALTISTSGCRRRDRRSLTTRPGEPGCGNTSPSEHLSWRCSPA